MAKGTDQGRHIHALRQRARRPDDKRRTRQNDKQAWRKQARRDA